MFGTVKQLIRKGMAKSLWLCLGRRGFVRLSTALANEARLDCPNMLGENGEQLVMRGVLKNAPAGRIEIFDVGANVGHWSARFFRECDRLGRSEVFVRAFEPCGGTAARCRETLQAQCQAQKAVVVQKALSDKPGTAMLNIVGDGSVVNSLHDHDYSAYTQREEVELVTVDSFGLDRIALLKIDAEGHDMSVMAGASQMLGRQAIDVIQFEYNNRWIIPRYYLRDVFEFLHPFGYRLGKVTVRGIEFYEKWHPELESYREGNYLACRPSCAEWFPTIPWWGGYR